MKNLPTLKLRKRIVCNKIKYALLKERNNPFLVQADEVVAALKPFGSSDGKPLIDKRTWESWFDGDGELKLGKVKKFQKLLNCDPPLDIWLDVEWLFAENSEFEKWLHPINACSSLLIHLAAIDALGWYRDIPSQGKGSWLQKKEKMSIEILRHLHNRWQLDEQNRVGLRNAHPPRAVEMMRFTSVPSNDDIWKIVELDIPVMERAKRVSWLAELGLMPSEEIESSVANFYEPLSSVSVQNFLFNLPRGLNIVDYGAIEEWALDLSTATAAYSALASTLRHQFYISQNMQKSRTMIDGLERIFWGDDCEEKDFNNFFAWVLQLNEIFDKEYLTVLHAARISYHKQLAVVVAI